MTIHQYTENSRFICQDDRRLSSKDRVWILTDIYSWQSSYYGYSPEQKCFRVGALDLRTNNLGEFWFTIDDARALLKAGIPAPPWTAPSPFGIEVCRAAHDGTEKGRYHVSMTAIDLPDDLVALGSHLRGQFRSLANRTNSTPGMWQDMVDAIAVVKKIEEVALGMTRVFSAKDVRKIVGDKVNVTPVLTNLCKRELLHKIGEKKGTRYAVARKTATPWAFEVE